MTTTFDGEAFARDPAGGASSIGTRIDPEAWSFEHNQQHHYRLGEDADPATSLVLDGVYEVLPGSRGRPGRQVGIVGVWRLRFTDRASVSV